jgi:hypothetical protein
MVLGQHSNALFYWSRFIPETLWRGLRPGQRIAHIPGRHELGHKDSLARLMRRLRRERGSVFDIVPETFVLPEDAEALAHALESDAAAAVAGENSGAAGRTWIKKPACESRGRGIQVFRGGDAAVVLRAELDAAACGRGPKHATAAAAVQRAAVQRAAVQRADVDRPLQASAATVVQRYIERPFLIGGKKFDLRVYVLITSVDPLRAYRFSDGIVKFCTHPFREIRNSGKDGAPTDIAMADLGDRYAHLANNAINAGCPGYVESDREDEGSRWTIRGLLRRLRADPSIGPAGTDALEVRLDRMAAALAVGAAPHCETSASVWAPRATRALRSLGSTWSSTRRCGRGSSRSTCVRRSTSPRETPCPDG